MKDDKVEISYNLNYIYDGYSSMINLPLIGRILVDVNGKNFYPIKFGPLMSLQICQVFESFSQTSDYDQDFDPFC